MNADRVINKINIDMNAFNESGSREDKACAEGLRRARTYIQQEVLKRKILTHDQQVVLEWLKRKRTVNKFEPLQAIVWMSGACDIYFESELGQAYYNLTDEQEFQVLAAFAEWGLKEGEG